MAFNNSISYYVVLGAGGAVLVAFLKLLYDWSGLFLHGRERPVQPWQQEF